MEENIYDFLGLTPKDGEAKVKEEQELTIDDFIDDFSRKDGMDKYITNEDKSVLMLEGGSPEFETNDGAHHKWTKKEFYVKK